MKVEYEEKENIIDKSFLKDLKKIYTDKSDLKLSEQVAQILSNVKSDQVVIKAGFLAKAFRDKTTKAQAEKLLTQEEKSLLLDLEKIAIIDVIHENKQQNTENLRQMLIAMVDDIRVVIIKLALQLVAMRDLDKTSKDEADRLAKQTKDIFAPLANRLGIAKIKWELEDLSLRQLEPTTYKLIASSLAEQRQKRDEFIQNIVLDIKSVLKQEGVESAQIYGRAKHINSIYAKMKKKHKRLEEIYDLLALRVEVKTIKDCYTVLGVVHSKYKHIPSEFDDYIANPKPNGYQSLHTAVIGPNKKTIEIQIRTTQMHEFAELGVAAHWRYKENSTAKESSFDKQISWLRQLVNTENTDNLEIAEEFSSEIAEDRVYVLTPQGFVIDLPKGSTGLDFAYRIHTDLGHKTRGVLVNGKLCPITYNLETGDKIEILTNPKINPSRDWLNPSLGYLATAKARSKVRAFFKNLEKDSALIAGKEELMKALKKSHISILAEDLEKTVVKFNFKAVEELYTAVGFGNLGVLPIMNFIKDLQDESHSNLDDIQTRISRIPISKKPSSKSSVTIQGISDLLISIASCCSPVPPDEITGFITKTKGISIHKKDCHNLIALRETQCEQIVEVDWSSAGVGFSTVININAMDRIGLLKNISQLILNEKIKVYKVSFSRDEDMIVNLQLQISVNDTKQLNKFINKLKLVKNVHSANQAITR